MTKKCEYTRRRVSIAFPVEMLEVIESLASSDDRSITWEVVRLVKAQLELENKESASNTL